MTSQRPLEGVQVVSMAVNLPGPYAAARLRDLGARVVKVEPQGGDGFALACPEWFRAMHTGIRVVPLDLKEAGGRAGLDALLVEGDLLLTSTRPASLRRLGLDWDGLHACYPRLCQVAIIGHPRPDEEIAGHDLTYQAEIGLVRPPEMPRTLVSDLAGAERAVSMALALLLGRERSGEAGYAEVSLVEAAVPFALPVRYGLTEPEGVFGGATPGYGLYRAGEGWVAIAALEGQFWERLTRGLGLDPAEAGREALEWAFAAQPAEYWEAWGREHDVPIAVVRAAMRATGWDDQDQAE